MRSQLALLSLVALAGGMSLLTRSERMVAFAQSAQAAAGPGGAAQGSQAARPLTPNSTLERALAGGENHTYQITLTAGQYLFVAVEPQDISLVVALLGPDDRPLIEKERPPDVPEPAQVSIVTEAAGDYKLSVRPLTKEAKPGGYKIKTVELRAATPADRSRAAAEKMTAVAEQLRKQGTAESMRGAIAKYQESLPLWRSAQDQRREARALTDIGDAHYWFGELREAINVLTQALPLSRAAGDRIGESFALNTMGSAYGELGDYRRAIECLEQSLLISREIGDRSGEAATLNNLGAAYDDLGEKQKALDCYRQALALLRDLKELYGQGFLLNNIGLAYYELGDKQQALEYLGQALAVKRELGDQRGQAVTLNNLGLVHNSLDEKQKALEVYDQALAIWRKVGNRQGEASMLSNRGMVFHSLGERQKALKDYEEALALIREVGYRRGEAGVLNNLGGLYHDLSDEEKALTNHRAALEINREIGDRGGEADSLFGLARVESVRGDLGQARAHVEEALDIVESVRTGVVSQSLRSSYLVSKQNIFWFQVNLLMQSHRREPARGYDALALQASERARARSLLETLAEARADIRQGVDPALLEGERALQRRLNAKEQSRVQLLSGPHTAEQAAAVKKEVETLLAQYQEAQERIRDRNPRYNALTRPVPLSLKEIQRQVLDDDTLLLEYALDEERSFLWAVTQTSISAYELPKRAEINQAAERAYKLLAASGQRAVEFEAKKAAAELSRIALGPVASKLGQSNLKRLLIVSDGALQYVPFGALPNPALHNAAPDKAQPMIVSHEIISLPSASMLAVLRREVATRRPAANAVAVFSDPVFQPDDPRVKRAQSGATVAVDDGARKINPELSRSAAESGLMSFERLRFTRQEAETVVSLARDERSFKALDFAASRATIGQTALDQYRIVHFATHGLLNSQHPELSGVVLSLVDERGRPQDGFLRAHEIYNLKLNADLVVLSACRTALGKEIKGEGLVGLTRGFMYAGAARVVASMWDVKDEATAELMKRFYQGMFKEGLRPSEALRAAQVSMWKEPRWNSPYYWAGFTLQGEWK